MRGKNLRFRRRGNARSYKLPSKRITEGLIVENNPFKEEKT